MLPNGSRVRESLPEASLPELPHLATAAVFGLPFAGGTIWPVL
jgi:hypothetical protein